MNKIFDDDSALKQKKQNECFSPEKEINIHEFRAISIQPRRTPLFCPGILTLFSFVFTLVVIGSLSNRPRHCKRKELSKIFLHIHFNVNIYMREILRRSEG